jgi:dynein heavy chain
MMQDTLLALIRKSYYNYYDFIVSFIPKNVIVNSSSSVENVYDETKPFHKVPLFTIDLQRTLNEEDFVYSTVPANFVSTLLLIFDKTLEEVAKIADIEPKILSDLYKSQKNETFIKAPMKPREKPVTPEGAERAKHVPDENKWIWDLYELLKEELQRAIIPL